MTNASDRLDKWGRRVNSFTQFVSEAGRTQKNTAYQFRRNFSLTEKDVRSSLDFRNNGG